MLTLHPQSAMEHLHARFRAADGVRLGRRDRVRGDRGRADVPGRARWSRSARPSRWPARPTARRSRSPTTSRPPARPCPRRPARPGSRPAARSSGIVRRVQDLMPRRKPAYRRVTPLASRRETQRRAAVAVLALLVVVGGLGLAVYAFGGQRPQQAISSVNAGQDAIDAAHGQPRPGVGPGHRPVADDPGKALELLTGGLRRARQGRGRPGRARGSSTRSGPQVVAGLDRLYGVVEVASTHALQLQARPKASRPFDLRAMVRGPDGAPYVIDRDDRDRSTGSTSSASGPTPIVREGQRGRRARTIAAPRFLAVGRPRPADPRCQERPLALAAVERRRQGHAEQGQGQRRHPVGRRRHGHRHLPPGPRARACTTCTSSTRRSSRSGPIPPAGDGSGFPAKARRLAGDGPGRRQDDLHVHRRRHLHHRGRRPRALRLGQERRLGAGRRPGTTLLREAPDVDLAAGAGERREGTVFAYDQPNARLIAYDKATGDYLGQYRLAGDADGWEDLRGLYVLPGRRGGPADRWSGFRRSGVHQAILEPVPDDAPTASPGRPAPRRRPAHRPPSPSTSALSPGATAVIPLRDANPTRRTPIVTLGAHRRLFRGVRLRAGPAGERR